MAEIIKTYREKVPAIRFIGKQYGNQDRVDGTFGSKWDEWFENGWFEELEKLEPAENPEADAFIGLMRRKDGEPFEYWIGMFRKEGTEVPEGFSYVDFPESDLGVVWLYGKGSELYCLEDECAESCKAEGLKIIPDEAGAYWFFERYACPRFTQPDADGCVILDICHFIAKE